MYGFLCLVPFLLQPHLETFGTFGQHNRSIYLLHTSSHLGESPIRNNVELPVISKALGHTNPTTTLTYISEIGDNRMAQANEKLLNKILPLNPNSG